MCEVAEDGGRTLWFPFFVNRKVKKKKWKFLILCYQHNSHSDDRLFPFKRQNNFIHFDFFFSYTNTANLNRFVCRHEIIIMHTDTARGLMLFPREKRTYFKILYKFSARLGDHIAF